jgi:uncharacterized damage-inducible protein DinB
MDATAVVTTALTIDMNNFIKGALNGLSDADLAKQPSDQCNSIGWTLWHATRVEDGIIANISGKPQVWIEGGWHQKFGMAANPGQTGVGDSLEQVAAFKPTVANLQGYAEAVREKTLACLNALTPADLDRDLTPPGGGNPATVGSRLAVILLDHLHHSGQVCYIRGYLTGKGWIPR